MLTGFPVKTVFTDIDEKSVEKFVKKFVEKSVSK